jgi:acyl carrier protein
VSAAPAPAPGAVLDAIREELAVLDPDVALERVEPGAAIASLDVESLTLMALIAELEARYGIRIPEHELTGLARVEELVELVRARAGAGSGA